jgi:predicted PhzF superfamily epimerase YddE/YHI9
MPIRSNALVPTPLKGNPCVVLADVRGLSDAEIQATEIQQVDHPTIGGK